MTRPVRLPYRPPVPCRTRAASIQILYEPVPTPRRVSGLDGVKVLKVAAGQQHCLAYDNEGSCYSWGNGGYGRLGHKVRGACVLRLG